ncbi:hypothetical protein AURDEDRAFT_176247 [Auricularia subglabra TFB-10046 SS5]|uniref:F-box domain-containing protein n=1 Tax=Auricularia subglabra (strain TFB-10046 / SS5) TaxID=717982 RepID=J0WRR7_AURST|nr:hypothetical protein AURDEDRAFT_176247 [Auricularia subglabra TFB-10046 SS5]
MVAGFQRLAETRAKVCHIPHQLLLSTLFLYSADTSSQLQAVSSLARRELTRFAASLNERNTLVSLPSPVLSRILFFTPLSDCVHVSQTCSLLHKRILEMPQVWAAVSVQESHGMDESGWQLNDERMDMLIRRSAPEPLARLRLVWKSDHTDLFARLLDDTLPRVRALSITAPLRSSWEWHLLFPHVVAPAPRAPASTAGLMAALAAPAPLLESFGIAMFSHPLFTDESAVGPTQLPADLFGGACGSLRTCGLTNVSLPPGGCAAFANVRALDWRTDHKAVSRDSLLALLDSFPCLETLRLMASDLEWAPAPLAVAPRRVQNVHLDVPRVAHAAAFLEDLGADCFVFDELTLDPETRLFDVLAASEAFEMTAVMAGTRLCEATARFHGRDLRVRCHPAEPMEYFGGRMPCIPEVPALGALTSFGIHEFFWPNVADPMNIMGDSVEIPAFPALRELRVFLASCADYNAELEDGAGVLQQHDLVPFDTPVLERVHLSYTLVDACGAAPNAAADFWTRHLEREMGGFPAPSACSCKATLGLSLLDVHAFLAHTVLADFSNPPRLKSIALTGIECADADGGAEGMALLTALADDVRVSPESEPTNCDVGADVWWTTGLGHMFRDSLL